MSLRSAWRKIVNVTMFGLSAACALLTVSALLFILGYLVWHGGRELNWNFFTRLPAPVGEPGGGMANAMVGSAKLLLLAASMGIPIGVLTGTYLAEFGGRACSFVIRYTIDLFNGVPSIVIGIFAYAVVVLPLRHFSTLAGGFALGVIMIPITARSTEQFLLTVPRPVREAAMALGASRWRSVATVVVPAALPGIVTGVLLALARVAGETAPLLFTAFNNFFWSRGWTQPTASLPVMIYNYSISPYDDWHRLAWAAGLVLLAFVVVVNVAVRVLLGRRISFGRA